MKVNAHMRNATPGIEENQIAFFEFTLTNLPAKGFLLMRRSGQ
jgi:hypothetical protein